MEIRFILSSLTAKNVTKNVDVRVPTMVEVVVIPADGRAGIGPLGQVMTGLTGSALITAAPGAALTGGVAPLATPAVAPESPGTL